MIPIWRDRNDGYWFYVEQAIAEYQDKPYRQRVYHLTQYDDSTFRSEVYIIDDPLRFAGKWRIGIPLGELTSDSLRLREGCSIYLHHNSSDAFSGSTHGKNCQSNLRGASYATSEVIIRKREMISWDRGFDSVDQQVWGAEKGGYIFKKTENY
jgi:hypothetical protein